MFCSVCICVCPRLCVFVHDYGRTHVCHRWWNLNKLRSPPKHQQRLNKPNVERKYTKESPQFSQNPPTPDFCKYLNTCILRSQWSCIWVKEICVRNRWTESAAFKGQGLRSQGQTWINTNSNTRGSVGERITGEMSLLTTNWRKMRMCCITCARNPVLYTQLR